MGNVMSRVAEDGFGIKDDAMHNYEYSMLTVVQHYNLNASLLYQWTRGLDSPPLQSMYILKR